MELRQKFYKSPTPIIHFKILLIMIVLFFAKIPPKKLYFFKNRSGSTSAHGPNAAR